MNIGLIGAPGSGKSNLALELEAQVDFLNDAIHVIDHIPQKVEEHYDFALEFGGSYAANLAVALERLSAERRADRDDDVNHRITCGTLVETSVYEAVQAFSSENEAIIWRAYNTMQVFASLFMDAWDYDIVFHLPGSDEKEFSEIIRKEIPLTIEKTGLEVIELEDGNLSDDTIKAIQERHAVLASA